MVVAAKSCRLEEGVGRLIQTAAREGSNLPYSQGLERERGFLFHYFVMEIVLVHRVSLFGSAEIAVENTHDEKCSPQIPENAPKASQKVWTQLDRQVFVPSVCLFPPAFHYFHKAKLA